MTTDWSPVFISMKTASLSIFITFFVGLFVAWGLVKLKNDSIKIVLDGIFTLPLVLPPTVVGFFLLWIFGVRGPIGKFFIDFFTVKIAFSWSATVIAAPLEVHLNRWIPTCWMLAVHWACPSGKFSGRFYLQTHCRELSVVEFLPMPVV